MILDTRDAFLHVIYEYRYLAVAGFAWDTIGPTGDQQERFMINTIVPQISTLVQDSLHLHARSLIDFYTSDPRADDIALQHFDGLSLSSASALRLIKYKKPIERHSLHLTCWRDVYSRAQQRDATKFRLDWNIENSTMVRLLLDALKEASLQSSKWQQPFMDLYLASAKRLTSRAYAWPKELTEKADVNNYLTTLGI